MTALIKQGNKMIRVVKKPHIRKQEIIDAARELFLKRDYDKTSMQSIVDHLNIAKGTIYHYFKEKEELLEAVIQDIVHEDFERRASLLEKAQGNALEKIRLLVEVNSLASTHEPLLRELHKPGNASLHTRLLAVTLLKEASLYATLIEQGCKEGLFKTEFPLESAEFLLSGIQFLTDSGIYPWPQKDLVRRIAAFPELVEALLKAPEGSFRFLRDKFKL